MSSFDTGFLIDRNSGWAVNPTTRCIVVPTLTADFQRVAELHGLHGDHLLRRRNPKTERYANVPQLADTDLYHVAKLEHELDHLQKHLSTSYGSLIHLI